MIKLTDAQKAALRKSKLLSTAQKPTRAFAATPKHDAHTFHGEEVHNPHFHAHNARFEQMLRKELGNG
jgi:hypothetical protein